MKVMLRRTLLIALLALTLLGLLAIGVGAAAMTESFADDAAAIAGGAVAKITDGETTAYYAKVGDALEAVDDGQTITLLNATGSAEGGTELDFDKSISFTITGTAPNYAFPIVTFTNATVTFENAEIRTDELDARQNATINVVNTVVHGHTGGDEIVKSYYNGAINIKGNSVVHTMQLTTMGYITISDTAKVNATTGINVFGNGMLTVKDNAVLATGAFQLTAKEYNDRDNTDADRVGKPATVIVDGGTLKVGEVYSESGSDYSYNSNNGINIGTIAGKPAVLEVKNGGTVSLRQTKAGTATIGADGIVLVNGGKFVTSCVAGTGTTLKNNGTVYVTGTSTLSGTYTGSGWVYMNGVALDENTVLDGAKVAFIAGTNTVSGSVIDNGFFSVGVGQDSAAALAADFATANGITLGDVTVTVSDDARIGSDGSTYSGWVGSAYSADKTVYTYVLNIKNSQASFGYLHVSMDGTVNVTGAASADNKYKYEGSVVDFYAGDFIINGTVTFDSCDAWGRYTKIAADNNSDTISTLNIVNGASYEASIHNGGNASAALKFWNKNGVVNVDGGTLDVTGATTLYAKNALNVLGGATLLHDGKLNNGGVITVANGKLSIPTFTGNTIVTAEGGATLTDTYINGSLVMQGDITVVTGLKLTGDIIVDKGGVLSGDAVTFVDNSTAAFTLTEGATLALNCAVTTTDALLAGWNGHVVTTNQTAIRDNLNAVGYAMAEKTAGVWTVGITVAKIGDTNYQSLADALAAAQDGDTIVLISNVTVPSTLAVTANVTIDGANFTITSDAATAMFKLNASLVINNASIINNVETAPVFLMGDDVDLIVGSNAAINSARILDGYDMATHTHEVTVGSIALAAALEAEGYYMHNNDDGTYTISEHAVAKIGNTLYHSLADALAAAHAGDTIIILQEIELADTLVIDKSLTFSGNFNLITSHADNVFELAAGVTLTINCKVEADAAGAKLLKNFADQTVKTNNADVRDMLNAEGYAMVEESTGVWTVKVAKAMIGTINYASLADALAAAVSGDEIVLLADAELTSIVIVPVGKTLTINGGAFTITSTASTAFIVEGNLTVNGALVNSYATGSAFTMSNGATLAINGAVTATKVMNAYNKDQHTVTTTVQAVAEKLNAEGYALVKSGDVWTVMTDAPEASVDGWNYVTVEDAIAVGGTVTLLRDVTVEATVEVVGNLTFTGNYTLTSTAASAFKITSGTLAINCKLVAADVLDAAGAYTATTNVKAIAEQLNAEGYSLVLSDGVYTITSNSPQVSVDGWNYDTMKNAILDLKNGKFTGSVLRLLKDFSHSAADIDIYTDLTIYGDGYTMTSTASTAIRVYGCTVTFENFKLVSSGDAIVIREHANDSHVVINNSTIDADKVGVYMYAVKGGSAIIKGNTVINAGKAKNTGYALQSYSSDAPITVQDNVALNSALTLAIYFNGTSSDIGSSKLIIKDNVTLSSETVHQMAISENSVNSTWDFSNWNTYKAYAYVKNSNKYQIFGFYTTLKVALEADAISHSETVTNTIYLLGNATDFGGATVSKPVIIDGNGYSVTVAAGKTAFTLTADSTAVALNNIAINGEILAGYNGQTVTTNNEVIANTLNAKGYSLTKADGIWTITSDTPEAVINGWNYATLQDAVNAAAAGDTVALLRDLSLSATVTINKNVTLNGNGKKITSSAATALNVTNTSVTLNGMDVTATAGVALALKADAATLTITNSTFNASAGTALKLEGTNTDTAATIALAISGSTFTATKHAILVPTQATNAVFTGEIVNSTLTSTGDAAVFLNNSDQASSKNKFSLTFTNCTASGVRSALDVCDFTFGESRIIINGGTFTGAKRAVWLGGQMTLDVNGATLSTTADEFDAVIRQHYGSKTTTVNLVDTKVEASGSNGKLIYSSNGGFVLNISGSTELISTGSNNYGIWSGGTSGSFLNVTMTGGKIATERSAICVADSSAVCSVQISGGSITVTGTDAAIDVAKADGADIDIATCFITADKGFALCSGYAVDLYMASTCTFTANKSIASGYAAAKHTITTHNVAFANLLNTDGFAVVEDAGLYSVVGVGVITIDGWHYVTLKAALAASKDGDVLEVVRDFTHSDGQLTVSASITIDGNGFTLTSTSTGRVMYGYGAALSVTIHDLDVTATNGEFIGLDGGKLTMTDMTINVKTAAVYHGSNRDVVTVLTRVNITATGSNAINRTNAGIGDVSGDRKSPYTTTMTLIDCEISAVNGWGIALADSGSANCSGIIHLTLTNTNVTGLGGVLTCGKSTADDSSTLTITNGTITATGAYNADGKNDDSPKYSGIIISGSAITKVTGTTFVAPNATAITYRTSTTIADVTLTNVTIGTADVPVGRHGIYIYQSAANDVYFKMVNSTIVANDTAIRANGRATQTVHVTVENSALPTTPNVISKNNHGIAVHWSCDLEVTLTNAYIQAKNFGVHGTQHTGNYEDAKIISGTITGSKIDANVAVNAFTAPTADAGAQPMFGLQLTVTDSTLIGSEAGVRFNPLAGLTGNYLKLDGKTTVEGKYAIYMCGEGDLTITAEKNANGTLTMTGTTNAIYIQDTLTVSFTADGGSITSTSGAAIYRQGTNGAVTTVVALTDVALSSEANWAIDLYQQDFTDDDHKVDVTMTNCIVTGAYGVRVAGYELGTAANTSGYALQILGGSISTTNDVLAIEGIYALVKDATLTFAGTGSSNRAVYVQSNTSNAPKLVLDNTTLTYKRTDGQAIYLANNGSTTVILQNNAKIESKAIGINTGDTMYNNTIEVINSSIEAAGLYGIKFNAKDYQTGKLTLVLNGATIKTTASVADDVAAAENVLPHAINIREGIVNITSPANSAKNYILAEGNRGIAIFFDTYTGNVDMTLYNTEIKSDSDVFSFGANTAKMGKEIYYPVNDDKVVTANITLYNSTVTSAKGSALYAQLAGKATLNFTINNTDVTAAGDTFFVINKGIFNLTGANGSSITSTANRGIYVEKYNVPTVDLTDTTVRAHLAAIEYCLYGTGHGYVYVKMTDENVDARTGENADIYSATYRGLNFRSGANYTIELENVSVSTYTNPVYRTRPDSAYANIVKLVADFTNCNLTSTNNSWCVWVGDQDPSIATGDTPTTWVFDLTFADCKLVGGGGVIVTSRHNQKSTLTMTDCTVDANTTIGISVAGYVDVTLTRVDIKGYKNGAASDTGAFRAHYGGTKANLTFTDVRIWNYGTTSSPKAILVSNGNNHLKAHNLELYCEASGGIGLYWHGIVDGTTYDNSVEITGNLKIRAHAQAISFNPKSGGTLKIHLNSDGRTKTEADIQSVNSYGIHLVNHSNATWDAVFTLDLKNVYVQSKANGIHRSNDKCTVTGTIDQCKFASTTGYGLYFNDNGVGSFVYYDNLVIKNTDAQGVRGMNITGCIDKQNVITLENVNFHGTTAYGINTAGNMKFIIRNSSITTGTKGSTNTRGVAAFRASTGESITVIEAYNTTFENYNNGAMETWDEDGADGPILPIPTINEAAATAIYVSNGDCTITLDNCNVYAKGAYGMGISRNGDNGNGTVTGAITKITLKNGTEILADFAGIHFGENLKNYTKEFTVTLENSTIDVENGPGLRLNGTNANTAMTLNVASSTITTNGVAKADNSATADVNEAYPIGAILLIDGKFTLNVSGSSKIETTNASSTYAIRMSAGSAKLTFTMSGGEIIAAKGAAVQMDSGLESEVRISGGTITSMQAEAFYLNSHGHFEFYMTGGRLVGATRGLRAYPSMNADKTNKFYITLPTLNTTTPDISATGAWGVAIYFHNAANIDLKLENVYACGAEGVIYKTDPNDPGRGDRTITINATNCKLETIGHDGDNSGYTVISVADGAGSKSYMISKITLTDCEMINSASRSDGSSHGFRIDAAQGSFLKIYGGSLNVPHTAFRFREWMDVTIDVSPTTGAGTEIYAGQYLFDPNNNDTYAMPSGVTVLNYTMSVVITGATLESGNIGIQFLHGSNRNIAKVTLTLIDTTLTTVNTAITFNIKGEADITMTRSSIVSTSANGEGIRFYSSLATSKNTITLTDSTIEAGLTALNPDTAGDVILRITMSEAYGETPTLLSRGEHGIHFQSNGYVEMYLENVYIYAGSTGLYRSSNPNLFVGRVLNSKVESPATAMRISLNNTDTMVYDWVAVNSEFVGITYLGGINASEYNFSGCTFYNDNESALVIRTKGVINMSGCTITSDTAHSIFVDNGDNKNTACTINAENCNLYSLARNAILVDANTTTVINLRNVTAISKEAVIYMYGSEDSELNIAGGVFLCNGDNGSFVIDILENVTANIYGGYFGTNSAGVLRARDAALMNVYGGYFEMTPNKNHTKWTGMIRLGTDKGAGQATVNVYGGTFVAPEDLYTVFNLNRGRGINLYGFNAIGGQYLYTTKNSAKVEMEYPTDVHEYFTNTPVMVDGAQVKLVLTEDNAGGIRFVSNIDAATIDYAKWLADDGNVSFGTVIAPLDYVQMLPAFTVELLNAAELPYLDIVAKDGLIKNADGSVTLRAVISEIKEHNYDRVFAAIAYAKVSVDGQDVYLYSAFDEEDNARSLEQLAERALADVIAFQTSAYRFAVGDGTYSRYTDEQRAALSRIVKCDYQEEIIIAPTETTPGLKKVWCDECGTYYEVLIPAGTPVAVSNDD